MIRKLVSVVVLVFVFMEVLGLTIDVHEVEAPYPIIYIRDDGSIDPIISKHYPSNTCRVS